MDIQKIRAIRIAEAIEKSGLTYAELERLTGISKSSLQRYATGGTKKVPIDSIESIAKATHTDKSYLMGWAQYGTQLQKARRYFGFEIDDLSNKTGIPVSTIEKYENNDSEPTNEDLELIAKAYGIELGSLIWNSFEPKTISNASLLPTDKIRMIPIYESVSAGFGAYADNYITGYTPCYIVNDEEARNTLCITVQGDILPGYSEAFV